MPQEPGPISPEQLLDALDSRGWEALRRRLQQSRFRRRFRLGAEEQAYLRHQGLARVVQEAQGFVLRRLAPARPPRDGKQTPYRGHPAFVAQHATATCCRKCLQRWHAIARGTALTAEQQRYVVAVLAWWLAESVGRSIEALWPGRQRQLF